MAPPCGASSQTSVVQTLQHSKKHFLTLVPELLQGRPGRSQPFSSVGSSGWTADETPRSQRPGIGAPARAAPGEGRGRRRKAPPRGRGRPQRGWGRGRRAGAGVSLPPSLSPVKSRGAAGLSPVSSSCSLGRAAVTVHRRRRGLHRVRPPARLPVWPPPPPAPASPTTTSFSRSSASTAHPPHAATPHPSPGAWALCGFSPRPPWPCTDRCSSPSTRPTPSFSRVLLRGSFALGSLSRSTLRTLQQLPGCCTRCCRGNRSPGTAPGLLSAPPLPHPSDVPLPGPCLPTTPSAPGSRAYSAPGPQVPRARSSGPSPALQLQPRCGARVWGDV